MNWMGSLRARITVGMLVLASVSSLLFAFGVFLANKGLETTVLQDVVQHEFNELAASSLENPEQIYIHSALLQGYVGRHNPALPAELLTLEPGNYHSFVIGELIYEVLVGDDRGRRLYVAYNITDWEIRERYMIMVLIAGVLLVAIGSVWLGFWSSRQIVQELVHDYRGILNGKALEIDCEIRGTLILDVAPSLPTIAISNLLRNAIENSNAGRISVTLDERSLVVADAGRGMSEADLARLFDRGFTTKEGAGGMGLYLVKRICDRFGWRIDVQSACGEGTVVRLLFQPAAEFSAD